MSDTTIAERLERNGYLTGTENVKALGGVWDREYACFMFPDKSAGAFTDIRAVAAERTLAGEPLLRFVVCEE